VAYNPIEYKGKIYESLKHLADAFSVHPKAFYSRLYKGLTLEEAILYEDTKNSIIFEGTKYANLKVLTQTLGISYQAICKRIQEGMPLEDAVTKIVKKREVTVNNREFKNIYEVSNFYGIDYSLLDSRLSRGMKLQEAVEDMLLKEKITLDGVEYNSLTTLCNAYLIGNVIVSARLKYGWSLKDALTRPVKVVSSKVTYSFRGKVYNSQRAMTENYGIQISLVRTFATIHNLSIVTALDILVTFLSHYKGERPKLISKIPVIIYNGKWYDTFKNLYIDICTDSMEVKAIMKTYKIKTSFDALVKMSSLTIEKYTDNQTNSIITHRDIREKYKMHVENAIIRGLVRKEVFKRYPNLRFYPTEYCATPRADFEVFIETHGKIKNR
jgi:hypothetical protein